MNCSISKIIEDYNSRTYSPCEHSLEILKTIEKLDSEINSFITVSKDKLLEKSREICEEKEKISIFENLEGIPVSYKDNINIKGEKTTNGSIIDKDNVVSSNADIVNLIESYGALTVGKNNMYEYSSGVTSENNYFGDIRNPIDEEKTAGGSSGGSAASVRSGMALVSIGTDTSGSTRIPAACCEVIGLKPTNEKISMKGITTLSKTLDHIGIMTRRIADLEIFWNTILQLKENEFKSNIILGIPSSYFSLYNDQNISFMIEEVHNQFKMLGFSMKEINTDFIDDPVLMSRIIGTSEFTVDHGDKILQAFDTNELTSTIFKGHQLKAVDYVKTQNKRKAWIYKMNEIFQEVDCIITPTLPIEVPEKNLETVQGMSIEEILIKYTSPFNITGHPALSIPSNISNKKIKNSFQIISDYNNEQLLFNLAKEYLYNFK